MEQTTTIGDLSKSELCFEDLRKRFVKVDVVQFSFFKNEFIFLILARRVVFSICD